MQLFYFCVDIKSPGRGKRLGDGENSAKFGARVLSHGIPPPVASISLKLIKKLPVEERA
jgi:hypothetical protein